MNTVASELSHRIDDKSAKVGVIGLGYVGLPLALLFAKSGYDLTGFDICQEKVDSLANGETYIYHIGSENIRDALEAGFFSATTDFEKLAEMDIVIICVPTPLSVDRQPDLRFVIDTTEAISRRLRCGQLIILESTTYPGTTAEIVKPILERTGLSSGVDFFLGYSPEREDPGNAKFTTGNIPKVVGGDGRDALELAAALYRQVVEKTVPVNSMATAEAVKITENVFRAVNIAMINELKTLYAGMDIDVWEVVKAASTKPFGYMPFYPGPGLGGHCIPIDPFYLSWKASQIGMRARFIELAGEINTEMPNYVLQNLESALDKRLGVDLAGANVLILGVAYKKNCDDTRESPALQIISLLEEAGAITQFHDPYISIIPPTRERADLAGRESVALTSESVAAFDAVLICADHDAVDYNLVVEHAKVVVDTRNATAIYRPRDNIFLS